MMPFLKIQNVALPFTSITPHNYSSSDNGPFAAERSSGTNRQTGDQITHWDMLNKATKFEFSLFKDGAY